MDNVPTFQMYMLPLSSGSKCKLMFLSCKFFSILQCFSPPPPSKLTTFYWSNRCKPMLLTLFTPVFLHQDFQSFWLSSPLFRIIRISDLSTETVAAWALSCCHPQCNKKCIQNRYVCLDRSELSRQILLQNVTF